MSRQPATPLAASRRRRPATAGLLCLALLAVWLQWAWHKPMALAAATGAAPLVAVACGAPLDADDIDALIAQGLLPAGEAGQTAPLCDLLTAPPAAAPAGVLAQAEPARHALPAPHRVLGAPATPRTVLPPARAPPVS